MSRNIGDRLSWQRPGSLLASTLLKLYSMLYYRLVIIDWSMGWVPFGIREASKIIKQQKIDVLYVHGQPPSSFLIGTALKRKYGIPLIIDYDDPWSCTESHFPHQRTLSLFINRLFERYVLETADRVVYCKHSILEDIRRTFPSISADKFYFLPNGYDPDDFPLGPIANTLGRFRIVYAGKLNGAFCYSPLSFLCALGQSIDDGTLDREKIEVIIVGTFSDEYKKLAEELGLGGIVRSTGMRPHREAVRFLKTADALLFVIESPQGKESSMAFSGSMPSKIFEYLYTGRPILAIVPPGPERRLLEEYGPAFFADPNDYVSVKHALWELIRACRVPGKLPLANEHLVQRFDRRRLTCQLARLFDDTLPR